MPGSFPMSIVTLSIQLHTIYNLMLLLSSKSHYFFLLLSIWPCVSAQVSNNSYELNTTTFPSVFRVVTNHRPPFVFVSNSSINPYTGLLVDFLPILFIEAGLPPDRFQWYTSSINAGGSLGSNGSWTGELLLQSRFGSTLSFQDMNMCGFLPASCRQKPCTAAHHGTEANSVSFL